MDKCKKNSSDLIGGQLLRQSFDRFDDKLVENILSYLTFTEKVMFESISKRFKKFVYNKQKHFSLYRGPIEGQNSLNGLLVPLEVVDLTTGLAVTNNLMAVNKLWLKSILKKCNSIETIVLDCFLDLEVLDIIGQNCPRLKSLRFDITGLNADELDQFGQRYGHLINTLQIYSVWPYIPRYYSNKFLIHCKNLKHLRSPRSCELLSQDSDYLPQLESVDDFCLGHLSDEECDEQKNDKLISKFNMFCQKYSQTMKKIKILAYNTFDQAQLQLFFTSVCKFNNLTHLELDFDTNNEINQSINGYLTQISRQNPSLVCFKLSLYTEWIQIDHLFYAFEGFTNLVELKIGVIYYNDIKPIKGSVECFKSLEKLKSFEISYKQIEESFFEDIDKYLPNLSTLIIECESEITDKTIFRLSHLKKLKKFYLNRFNSFNQLITDEGICAVLNGCPALEMICFHSRPNITNKTIKTLIGCANSRPKRTLKFEIFSSHPQNMNQDHLLDMHDINVIPSNLIITIHSVF